MKRQLTKIFRVVGVVILSAYLCDSLHAQVRIREKVSIDPKPTNTPPSVQSGDVSLVVKFTYSGTYRSDRAHFLRVTNCAVDQFLDPMSNSATLSVPARSGANKATIRFSTPEGGGSGTWHYSFEIDGTVIRQDENSVNCFCTIILLPEVFLQSGMRFTLPSSITHGESAAITMTSQPFTLCSKTVWHPLMKTTISITEGQELGNFYDENGVNLGTSVTGNQSELAKIRFVADGEQPEGEKATLSIDASSQGVSVGSGRVEIKESPTAPVIDSVRTVAGKLRFPLGTTVGFLGYFHDNDDNVINAEWTKVSGPTVVSTTTNAEIQPQLSISSFAVASPSASSFPLTEPGFHVFRFTVKDEAGNMRGKKITVEAMGLDHFVITTDPDTVSFGKTAVILAKPKDQEENDVEIDENTGLFIVLAQNELYGNLIAPNGTTGKTVSALYKDVLAGKVLFLADGDPPGQIPKSVQVGVSKIGDESKSGVGTIVVTGEPELELVITKKDYFITESPEMPNPEISARLNNYEGGTVQFQWILNVKWTTPQEKPIRFISNDFHGATTAQNSEVSKWTLSWDGKIRGGDEVSVRVIATANGKTYQAEENNPLKILGMNPGTIAAVKDGLTTEEQVIVYLESLPKWKHFRSNGFPIFGSPKGFGLMQLDEPTATDEEVWNWVANKSAGKKLFAQKKNLAKSYSTRINNGTTWYWKDKERTKRGFNDPIGGHWEWYPQAYLSAKTLTDGEQALKEAFQRYNGGVYWRWKLENEEDKNNVNANGKWVKITGEDYGDRAWEIFDGITKSSAYPEGWN